MRPLAVAALVLLALPVAVAALIVLALHFLMPADDPLADLADDFSEHDLLLADHENDLDERIRRAGG